jgi:hypothetical protein
MPSYGAYDSYLNILGQWPSNIALASQWYLHFNFDGLTALTQNFQNLLKLQETNSEWSYNPVVASYLTENYLSVGGNGENYKGSSWARQVTLPSETIEAGNNGLEYGGFQAPATANIRQKYNKLSVTFLETNASFVDLIIRPWAVSVGYLGLVARPNISVKAKELKIYMLAKTGYGNPMGIRKVYTFKNVAPITVPTEEYSYLEEGLRTSSIDFVYDNYGVSDGDTGTLIGQL